MGEEEEGGEEEKGEGEGRGSEGVDRAPTISADGICWAPSKCLLVLQWRMEYR